MSSSLSTKPTKERTSWLLNIHEDIIVKIGLLFKTIFEDNHCSVHHYFRVGNPHWKERVVNDFSGKNIVGLTLELVIIIKISV